MSSTAGGEEGAGVRRPVGEAHDGPAGEVRAGGPERVPAGAEGGGGRRRRQGGCGGGGGESHGGGQGGGGCTDERAQGAGGQVPAELPNQQEADRVGVQPHQDAREAVEGGERRARAEDGGPRGAGGGAAGGQARARGRGGGSGGVDQGGGVGAGASQGAGAQITTNRVESDNPSK
eukprot:9441349-Pyramimonas_sp.AAC.1